MSELGDFKPGIIAITGHRDYPDRAALYRGLDKMSARHYYFGGARGVDSDALEYISRTQPHSFRTVVVPNRLENQPAVARAQIKKYSTNVIELKNSGRDRFMIRNRFMVNNSQRTNAFYDYRGRGGTFNTIEYARSKGKLGTVNSVTEFKAEQFRGMSKQQLHRTMNEMKRYKVGLSGLKMIVLEIIKNIYQVSIHEFFLSLGYSDIMTIEQFWLR